MTIYDQIWQNTTKYDQILLNRTKYDRIYYQNFSFESKKIAMKCFRSEMTRPPPSEIFRKFIHFGIDRLPSDSDEYDAEGAKSHSNESVTYEGFGLALEICCYVIHTRYKVDLRYICFSFIVF